MRRGSKVAAAAATTLALAAGSAYAVQTDLDDVTLTGPGTVEFNYGTTYTNHFMIDDAEFSPAADDAFDGAFELFVDDRAYGTPGGTGNFNGSNEVRGGSRKLSKLRVSRVDNSFPSIPTVRSLVKFKNPKRKAVRARVTWANNLGSDSETAVRATSSGNAVFNTQDRWGVTSDDGSSPSDAVVTLVHYGKGKVLKPKTQRGPQSTIDDGSTTNGDDRVEPSFNLRVPGRKTVYLMFFAEVHAENADAISDAGKFNQKGLSAQLLTDIPQSVRRKIANWKVG